MGFLAFTSGFLRSAATRIPGSVLFIEAKGLFSLRLEGLLVTAILGGRLETFGERVIRDGRRFWYWPNDLMGCHDGKVEEREPESASIIVQKRQTKAGGLFNISSKMMGCANGRQIASA